MRTALLTAASAASLMLTGTPAAAQNAVNLYGIVDTGVEYLTNANARNGSLVRVPSQTASLPSRLGISGSEQLGDGLSAIYTLEAGFNLDNGASSQGTRLFGRQAWVGLKGSMGTLTIGRVYSMMFWAIVDADIVGPGIYGGVGSFDPYIPNARSDNAVSYRGVFGPVTVGGSYALGRDAAGTGNSPGQGTCAGATDNTHLACRQWSTMARYDRATYGVAAAYDEQRGGAGAAANLFNGAAPLALTNAQDKDIRMQLNGYVKMAPLKLGGGWLGRRVRTDSAAVTDVRTNLYYLTAAWQFQGPWTVDGGHYRMINREQNTRGDISTIRALYHLSKRTTTYVQAGYLRNSDSSRYTLSQGGAGATPNAGKNQLGLMLGVRHAF
ncbi:MAG TPA: porin [Duganella sp.]